jgi:hypothetical protein
VVNIFKEGKHMAMELKIFNTPVDLRERLDLAFCKELLNYKKEDGEMCRLLMLLLIENFKYFKGPKTDESFKALALALTVKRLNFKTNVLNQRKINTRKQLDD